MVTKTNPAEKLDIYIEEYNTFFYNDIATKALTEQGSGGSGSSLFNKEFLFISGNDLDGDQIYYLSTNNIDKFNIVFIDSDLYPDAQIKVFNI